MIGAEGTVASTQKPLIQGPRALSCHALFIFFCLQATSLHFPRDTWTEGHGKSLSKSCTCSWIGRVVSSRSGPSRQPTAGAHRHIVSDADRATRSLRVAVDTKSTRPLKGEQILSVQKNACICGVEPHIIKK
jgi:hypothetical protein